MHSEWLNDYLNPEYLMPEIYACNRHPIESKFNAHALYTNRNNNNDNK